MNQFTKEQEALIKEQQEVIEVIKFMLKGTDYYYVFNNESNDVLRLGYDRVDSMIYGKYKDFKKQESDIKKDTKMREWFEKLENYVNKYKLDQVYEKQQWLHIFWKKRQSLW